MLKKRGTRLFKVVAEVFEWLPVICDEIRELPEIKNATNIQERRDRFGEAASKKFKEKFEAAVALLPPIDPNIGANMTNAASSISADLMARLKATLDGLGTSTGSLLEKIGVEVKEAARVTQMIIGGMIFYTLVIGLVTLFKTTWMAAIAWTALVLLIGVPTIFMVLGGLKKDGEGVQLSSSLFLAFVSTTLLVITFGLAGIGLTVVNEGSWKIIAAGPVIFLVWDRVVWGITQKLLNVPKFAALVIGALANDGTIEPNERENLNAFMRSSMALVRISITVVAVACLIWTLIIIIQMVQDPLPFLPAALLCAIHVALVGAYTRLSLGLWKENDWAKHLDIVAKGWGVKMLNNAWRMWIAVPIMFVVAVIGYAFFFKPSEHESRSHAEHAEKSSVSREADDETKIVRTEERKPIKKNSAPSTKKAEKMVMCNGKKVSAAKLEADLKSLNEKVDGQFCKDGMTKYPCCK
ncbi:MAG: hypothetical protein WC776_03215 [Patescibacteria group bacterium]